MLTSNDSFQDYVVNFYPCSSRISLSFIKVLFCLSTSSSNYLWNSKIDEKEDMWASSRHEFVRRASRTKHVSQDLNLLIRLVEQN